MSLSSKSLLLVSNDEKITKITTEALSPLVKNFVAVSNVDQAVAKATMQVFDGVLYRTKAASLANPKEFFAWSQAHKAYEQVPWVILGKDVEPAEVLSAHPKLKLLERADDGPGLIRILESLFFTATKESLLDVNFVNPLIGAVIEVIKSMGGVDLVRGKPFIKANPNQPPARGDVSGLIAMNSDRFLGSLAICFSEKLVLKVYAHMMQAPAPDLNEDVRDAVAEMTNIIFGHAKRDLNAAGHNIAMAIPSVITGKNHEISHGIEGVCICVPFDSPQGSLLVECVMRKPLPKG
jgi:chemotaxis protein CheX